MTDPARTCYPIDKPCPICGGPVASDGRAEWCMKTGGLINAPVGGSILPGGTNGDPCICGDEQTWHPECYRDQRSPVCVWDKPSDLWETQCENFMALDKNPEDLGYKWCPYCGGRLYNAETIDMSGAGETTEVMG